MKRIQKIWTEEEIELLKKLMNDSLNLTEISTILNRKFHSVCKKIYSLNLSKELMNKYQTANKKHQREIVIQNDKKRKNEKHPLWKGDNVGYEALHAWIKRHKYKTCFCEKCLSFNMRLDLANISGQYKRDVNDFEWLCEKCHIYKDKIVLNLKQFKDLGITNMEDYFKVHQKMLENPKKNDKEHQRKKNKKYYTSHKSKFVKYNLQRREKLGRIGKRALINTFLFNYDDVHNFQACVFENFKGEIDIDVH